MKDLTKIEEMLLIAIWHLKEKAYGVKIRQYVSAVVGRDLTYGHLYSALNQLVIKKYVKKSVEKTPAPRLGRPRIYYSISPEGADALKEAMVMNEKLWSGISRYALEKEK
jgi:DNA-binding PadR family transcriptional regulator